MSKHVKTATRVFLMDISLFVLLISKEGHRGVLVSTPAVLGVHSGRTNSSSQGTFCAHFSFFNILMITFLCRNGANIVLNEAQKQSSSLSQTAPLNVLPIKGNTCLSTMEQSGFLCTEICFL